MDGRPESEAFLHPLPTPTRRWFQLSGDSTYFGVVVHKSYNAGFIALSFVISVVGALTTLELLRRVTFFRGLLNWVLLISSAFSMGGVAIWSMHYIGNRGVILFGGEPELQLSYGAGFTITSFFIPIVVLLIAYAVIGGGDKIQFWRLIFGGTFAGTAICGMHYLGQLSIINYTSTYDDGHIVGSVVIAVAATNVALAIFFKLRERWDDAFWKRVGCALLLAAAVSGMHWTAATGTYYTPVSGAPDSSSAKWTVIVVAVISLISCAFLTAFGFIAGRRAKMRKDRAQKVVLACATFDPDGKVMLTTDGVFPCREITDSYHERSLDDSFDTGHPVFLWIFRASFNWDAIRDLVSGMRNHLKSNLSSDSADYSVLFREMFCIAARRLSDTMCLPFENMGILYDRILETGKTPATRSVSPGGPRFGKGQFLFLVKHASRAETEHLLASGYRFGEPSKVIATVARAMQVDRNYIEEELTLMREYHGPQTVFKRGVQVGFCDIRPNLARGFNVVVKKGQSHAIPASALDLSSLDEEQKAAVVGFAGQTVSSIVTDLSCETDVKSSAKVELFRQRFHHALITLAAEVNDVGFMDAVLLPETFKFAAKPGKGKSSRASPEVATLLIFRNVSPAHSSHQLPARSHLITSPLSLFLVQQSVLPHVRSNFPKEAREEFLRLFEGTVEPTAPELPGLGPWIFSHFMEEGKIIKGLGNDVSIEGGTELVQQRRILPPGSSSSGTRISGIVVHKSVAVTVREKESEDGSTISGGSKGTEKGLTPLMMDDAAWADILFKGILVGF